jgi:hypothetical protein
LCVPGLLVGGVITLAGCNPNNAPDLAAAQPRGASVAFESIDGLPQKQFDTLVQDLNDEAQARRLAVMAREAPSAYRVRGYLATMAARGRTTISWIWDVFDRDKQRALRISGSETATAGSGAGWQAADNATLQRIAASSMAELAAFLTSPAVAPGTPGVGGRQVAFAAPAAFSPEAAGIFRIFRPHADPVSDPAPVQAAAAGEAEPVPLPRDRPRSATAVSTGETVTLAASRQ